MLKKKKKLIFITPTILPNLLEYTLASKFLFKMLQLQKNFNYVLVKGFLILYLI